MPDPEVRLVWAEPGAVAVGRDHFAGLGQPEAGRLKTAAVKNLIQRGPGQQMAEAAPGATEDLHLASPYGAISSAKAVTVDGSLACRRPVKLPVAGAVGAVACRVGRLGLQQQAVRAGGVGCGAGGVDGGH